MEIWLKQGKEKLRLAVLPESYELTSESGNTQATVHSFGEINLRSEERRVGKECL